MSEEKDFFKICFNTVAGLEVKNESQAIAKEVVLSEVEQLQQENQQLKIQISAREEEYKKLEHNWNELKGFINVKLYNTEYLQKLCGCRTDGVEHLILEIIKNKMEELERGVSDVG